MAKMFGILLVLIAVLLMPFGMTPASASSPHHVTSAMPMQHCPEQPSHDGMKAGFTECTMACSAALPAMDGPATLSLRIASVPVDCPAARFLTGLVPEIATPPPKRA